MGFSMNENHEIEVRALVGVDRKETWASNSLAVEKDKSLEDKIVAVVDLAKKSAADDVLSKAVSEVMECPFLRHRFLEWGKDEARKGSDAMGNILVWLRIRRNYFSMSAVEIVEEFLKLGSERITDDLDKREQGVLISILQEICVYVKENILGCNRESICMFLFRIFLRQSRAIDTTKIFAFEVYIQTDLALPDRDLEAIVHEMDSLDTFDVGGMNFRDHVILCIYRRMVLQGPYVIEKKHESFVDILSEKFSSYHPSETSLISHPTPCSRILCVSLAFRYLKMLGEDRQNLDSKLLSLFLENMVGILRKNEYSEEEITCFRCVFRSLRPSATICRIIRSFVVLLLRILDSKKHESRMKAAKVLCSIQLDGMVIGKKIAWRILKIARKHVEDKRITVVRGVVNIIGQINIKALESGMQRLQSSSIKKIIFDKIKDSLQTEACYRAYIDLLGNKDTRDVEYKIEDIRLLAKVFYSYEDKNICRFMKISIPSIEDVFVAELAALYSKFYPDSVDEVYAASVLLNSAEEIVKSKNVPFYNNVLKVLMNLKPRFSSELKQRLAVFLRKLVFYSPYTRNAGMLINILGYAEMRFPRRTDYFVAILGSCGSPWMRDYFSEYPWSLNKELGLVYNLRFDPDFGVVYKWKLEEILSRMESGLEEREAAVCTEFLSFLSEAIELSAATRAYALAFETLAKNCSFIVHGAKSGHTNVSKEACILLKKATKAGAILPHVSIPVIFSCHLVSPEMVFAYFETTLSTMQEAIENKRRMFKEKRKIAEFRMVSDIYNNSRHRSRVVDRLLDIFDECPIKTYYLMVQVTKFEKKDFAKVIKGINSMAHSYDFDRNRLLFKLYELFSDIHILSRTRREIRVSNEDILFEEDVRPGDIDMLRLCTVK
ncbi:importin [Encephalitozoon hellem]|uniref:Importin n=1 Tax=Encephalitozoon hellem TaxID=27973 RepID=A0ABY8CJD1_ENCHE|nr:importin [Encephalitozoon hellem]